MMLSEGRAPQLAPNAPGLSLDATTTESEALDRSGDPPISRFETIWLSAAVSGSEQFRRLGTMHGREAHVRNIDVALSAGTRPIDLSASGEPWNESPGGRGFCSASSASS